MTNPTPARAASVNADLVRLVAAGKILRIKVWAPDGTIVYSDLPKLRGRRFPIQEDLLEVLEGHVAAEFSNGTDEENIFERGLADRLLSVYLPIRAASGTEVLGAYEVYEDAAPIDAAIARTRQDAVLIVVGMGLGVGFLLILWAAFSVLARHQAMQNRRLVEQSMKELALHSDLRHSRERFQSLVQNSADVSMILGVDGAVEYESSAVERVLGFRAEDRIGRSTFELIHLDDLARANELLTEVVRIPGAMATGEFRVKHADGSWRWLEAVGKNLFDDPAVGGLVINYRDITATSPRARRSRTSSATRPSMTR